MNKATHDTAVIEFPRAHAHNAAYDDVDFGGPSGPGGGGMLDARVARLESDVEHIRQDIADVKDSVKVLTADTTDIKIRLGSRIPSSQSLKQWTRSLMPGLTL